jgi:hypothetical protein
VPAAVAPTREHPFGEEREITVKALVWHGPKDVRVDTVDDSVVQDPTDAIVRVTTTGLCGSDLHLYEVLSAFMTPGDILGHEPMGVVEAVGSQVSNLRVGQRVVVPFNISCGRCFMCDEGLQSQCETTQVTEQGMGAALFGYTKLYGSVPGGKPNCFVYPTPTTDPSSFPKAHRTTASSTCPTYCPPPGRPSTMQGCRGHDRWSWSASDRSVTCAVGWPLISASTRSSGSMC